MRWLYSLLLYLVLPLVLLRLFVRGFKQLAYRRRWSERFAFYPAFSSRPRIWVHGVSVGETIAAAPLVRLLIKRFPDHSILLTTTTPTGSQQVRKQFGESVEHVYLPYDLPGAVKRFTQKTRPEIAIIMETEIWPNLFAQCASQDIPVVIANARLSERSTRSYKKLEVLTAEALSRVTLVAAQGRQDAERFIELGAAPGRVQYIGNIKFDIQVPATVKEQGVLLRRQLGAVRPVWIGASTHEGEDAVLLDAFDELRQRHSTACLILVPRHPERFEPVARLCEQRGYRLARRSSGDPLDEQIQVLLGDTMGELMMFYAASDVAFVGGSLVETGGHNPLEPAALSMPVLTGPHYFNFAEIYPALLAEGGAQEVKDSQTLAEALARLFDADQQRRSQGEAAYSVVEQNRGALNRLFDGIAGILEKRESATSGKD